MKVIENSVSGKIIESFRWSPLGDGNDLYNNNDSDSVKSKCRLYDDIIFKFKFLNIFFWNKLSCEPKQEEKALTIPTYKFE